MSLVRFRLAGSGGEDAYVNPAQVVCLMNAGCERTQVVTSALAGEAAISLIVAADVHEAAAALDAASSDPAVGAARA